MENDYEKIRLENIAINHKIYRLWLIGIVSVFFIASVSCNAYEMILNQNKRNLYNSPGFRQVEVTVK
jgi:hypothetical protein